MISPFIAQNTFPGPLPRAALVFLCTFAIGFHKAIYSEQCCPDLYEIPGNYILKLGP